MARSKLRITGIALVAAVCTVLIAALASPAYAVSTSTIKNVGSGLCAEPTGDFLGALVLQQGCTSSAAQLWQPIGAGGGDVFLVNQANRDNPKCLDVRDGVNANRTPVQLWACTGTNSMKWRIESVFGNFYRVISKIGGRCLDVAAGSLQPGARLQIYSCSGISNTAQVFEIL